jgi:16S rRNA (guanine527-N7)-methyltransferase
VVSRETSEPASRAPLPDTPASAFAVFGDAEAVAVRFAESLAAVGVERGLIGPREVERLWDRHLLNSAVLGELIPPDAMVVDLGSGAGLPGIPLALARPDLRLTLLEPMARRAAWLTETVESLGLDVSVVRGRAEEPTVKQTLTGADVVVARAVAPLARLWGWAGPLLREGGTLVALKGESAAEEVARDRDAVRTAGGADPVVSQCGAAVLPTPATVILVTRAPERAPRVRRQRRTRKDQRR